MRKTHVNHPCTIWTRQNLSNFNYVVKLTEALIKEYDFRYGKKDKFLRARKIVTYCKENPPNLKEGELTPFAQAMPDVYRNKCAISAYRDYYRNDKKHLFKWTNRPIPFWLNN